MYKRAFWLLIAVVFFNMLGVTPQKSVDARGPHSISEDRPKFYPSQSVVVLEDVKFLDSPAGSTLPFDAVLPSDQLMVIGDPVEVDGTVYYNVLDFAGGLVAWAPEGILYSADLRLVQLRSSAVPFAHPYTFELEATFEPGRYYALVPHTPGQLDFTEWVRIVDLETGVNGYVPLELLEDQNVSFPLEYQLAIQPEIEVEEVGVSDDTAIDEVGQIAAKQPVGSITIFQHLLSLALPILGTMVFLTILSTLVVRRYGDKREFTTSSLDAKVVLSQEDDSDNDAEAPAEDSTADASAQSEQPPTVEAPAIEAVLESNDGDVNEEEEIANV